MTDTDKNKDNLVITNKEVEDTEVKAEKVEEKVEGAVVTVVDMHVEAALVHKEAAQVHIDAAETNLKKGNYKNAKDGDVNIFKNICCGLSS